MKCERGGREIGESIDALSVTVLYILRLHKVLLAMKQPRGHNYSWQGKEIRFMGWEEEACPVA